MAKFLFDGEYGNGWFRLGVTGAGNDLISLNQEVRHFGSPIRMARRGKDFGTDNLIPGFEGSTERMAEGGV